VEEYGPKLVCVRYRYDDARKKRYKTVELIVEEVDWIPRPPRPAPTDLVHIRVAYSEGATRHAIKLLGGTWQPPTKTWRLAYAAAVALRLTDRIVDPSALGEGTISGVRRQPTPPPASTSRPSPLSQPASPIDAPPSTPVRDATTIHRARSEEMVVYIHSDEGERPK
jgi:hypothetical protein